MNKTPEELQKTLCEQFRELGFIPVSEDEIRSQMKNMGGDTATEEDMAFDGL